MTRLPLTIAHVGVPPVKCQGIKTKLVPFIFRQLEWEGGTRGRWIEPFLGSGCVAFNLAPDRAVLSDTNCHIIGLYKAIQSGVLTMERVREHLESEGEQLRVGGEAYYYQVRERFNQEGDVLDFLFLNRSCFNGVMRFNRQGKFNVPFGHKPERFSKAYITKIVNQVGWVARQMRGKEWEFHVASWHNTLAMAEAEDFVYLDPPYIGRHTDYFNVWNETEAKNLAQKTHNLPCGYALSMWLENQYRTNTHIRDCWSEDEVRSCSHFYHVGSTEELRNAIEEALVIRPGFSTPPPECPKVSIPQPNQLKLVLEQRTVYPL